MIEKQLEISKMLDKKNISKKERQELEKKQEFLFLKLFKKILLNHSHYEDIGKYQLYTKEIYSLEKNINRNKRRNNQKEVIQDKIQIASLKIVESTYKTIRRSLRATNMNDPVHFQEMIKKYANENDARIKVLNLKQFQPYLKDQTFKESLQELEWLLEINKDIIYTLNFHQVGIYKLGHYEHIGLLRPAIYFYESAIGDIINPYLKPYNLDITKIIFMLIAIFFILVIRKIGYLSMERLITKLTSSDDTYIIRDLVKIIDFIFITLAIHFTSEIYSSFQLSNKITTGFEILYAILVTLLVYKLANAIAQYKIKSFKNEKHMRQEIINISIKIINVIIILVGMIIVLEIYGANIKTILSGLGIGGLAVAFAARETLSNFFATISILASNMFSQGEWISIEDNEGVIVEIGLRVTTIRTFDNALISIPNAKLANNEIKNWSRRKLGRRIKLRIGVTYQSEIENIQKAVESIKTMLSEHPKVASEKSTYDSSHTRSLVSKEDHSGIKKNILVSLYQFSDSSIDILVYCFSRSVDWSDWLNTKEDIMYKIMEILKENHLEFAYPTLTIEPSNTETKRV